MRKIGWENRNEFPLEKNLGLTEKSRIIKPKLGLLCERGTVM